MNMKKMGKTRLACRDTVSFQGPKSKGVRGHPVIAVIMALVCCTTGFMVSFGTERGDAEWHDTDTGYTYFKRVDLADALNGYVMFLNVTKTSGGDMNCSGHCQDDFDDLRFIAADNVTILDYWIETSVSGSYARVWVELPSDVEDDDYILLVYGNSTVTGVSNGSTTFLFFDDFITYDTTVWEPAPQGTPTVMEATDGWLHLKLDGTDVTAGIVTHSLVATTGRLVAKVKGEVTSNSFSQAYNLRYSIDSINSLNNMYRTFDHYRGATARNDSWARGIISNDTYVSLEERIVYILKQTTVQKYGVFYDYYNGTRLGSEVSHTYSDGNINNQGSIAFVQKTFDDGLDSYVDWVFLAPYVTTEPTVSSISPEYDYGLPSENHPPTCLLTADSTSGTAPLIVTFTIIASDLDGFIAAWTLDTDNDGTSDYNGSGTPPGAQEHTYEKPGIYTANLTVTDNQGATDSGLRIITVNPAPPPNQPPACLLTANPINGTLPLTVTFTLTASDPDGTINAWTLDTDNDGTPEYFGVENPPSTQEHTYVTLGIYTANLTVIDNQSSKTSDTVVITVNDGLPDNQPPTCSLAAHPTNGTAPLTVTFTLNVSDPDGILNTWWTFDIDSDGTPEYSGSGSPPSTQEHTYTSPGIYTANLTVTDNHNATASNTVVITISQGPPDNQAPLANFTYSREELLVTFTDASTDPDGAIASWHWDFGDQTSSSASSPIHEYEDKGNYTVMLTVTDDDGETDSVTQVIMVEKDDDGDGGIPGFELTLIILSLASLLFITQRKRSHGRM